MKSFAALATLLALACGPALRSQQPVLPVRKVVVYKHGVGYFERQGKVTGDQKIVLSFKAAQMKDLLKSLYAVDLSGGRIASISYDTKDPLSKQLEDILIRVPQGNALTQFLTGLQGARIKARVSGEEVEGRILGIEPVVTETQAGTTTSWKLVLLRADGRIQPLNLLDASSLELLDQGLEKDLERYLEIYMRAKHADRKTVVLDAAGEGVRDVRVGYIVETPIWKTTYRLLYDGSGDPLLQGWAILENTSDEDWDQVDVSFVAGSPMSFIMDLYTAYYPVRREIPMEVVSAPVPESARPAASPLRGRFKSETDAAKDRRRAAPGQGGEKGVPELSLAEELEKAMPPAVEGEQVGELFAYRSREKVSVQRGQAALIPIISQRVPGCERVLYYRPEAASRALDACYLENATGLTLESGPVTFFEGSTCIGAGLLREVLKKRMKQMIPYAVEGGVSVELKTDRRSDPITSGRVVDGVLELTCTENLRTVYAIRSRLTEDETIYVDHRKSQGFELKDADSAPEEIEGYYRFRLKLPAGSTQELAVREMRPVASRVSLLRTTPETVRFYVAQRYLSQGVRKFLSEVASLQEQIGALRRAEAELDRERKQLTEDEARLRQNISVLGTSPAEAEMRSAFLARLERAETRLLAIRSEQEQKTQGRSSLEAELARKVRSFEEE